MNNIINAFKFDYTKVPEEIISLIKKSKNIAVIGHYEPDGDTIGSQLALVDSFRNIGKRSDAINQGPFNALNLKKYKKYFLKNVDDHYDLFILVDIPDKERIGDFYYKLDYEKTIVIDHHATNKGFGSINWINDNFLSTAEMVFLLLSELNIGLDNAEVSQHLLNGITSDNGYFQHIRKNKELSLLVSFLLIQNGADPRESYFSLYGKKTLESKKLLSLALDRIVSLEKGKILWTYLTEDDKNNHKKAHLESSFVFREMMTVENVEVAILFKILKNKIDISFRSNDKIDVSILAKMIGGGGHKAAAGASVYKRFDQVKDDILNKTTEHIRKSLLL